MPNYRRNHRQAPLVVSLLLLAALLSIVLAACGGGSDSTSSSAGSSSNDSETSQETSVSDSESTGAAANGVDVAQVEKKLAPALHPPKTVPLLTEALKHLPTGKTIEYLECSAIPCKVIGEGLKNAASIIGMKFSTVQAGATPESFQAAAQQAVEDNPDVVMMPAIDPDVVKKQLEEMKAEGIVTALWATRPPAKGLIDVFLLRPKEYYEAGAAVARYAILHSNGEANMLYFNQSVWTFAPYYGEGVQKTLEAECPKCSFSETDTLPEENGAKLPAKVASEVQANPSVNWVTFAYGAMNLGVPEALQAAELSGQVQLISAEAQANNLEYLKSGAEVANDASDREMEPAFYAIDGVARVLAGQKLPDYEQLNTFWFISPKEVEELNPAEPYHSIPDFQQQFEKVWGLN